MLRLLICMLVFCTTLAAAPKLPVDISFVVVDAKYNALQGLKICEVQNATGSAISKYYYSDFPDEDVRNYEDSIYGCIKKYYKNLWFFSVDRNKRLKELLVENGDVNMNLRQVGRSQLFSQVAAIPPSNPHDLSTYQGALYTQVRIISDLEDFQKKFPGVVVIDAATAPYWNNKKKMSQLFTRNEELAIYKPIWRSYSKEYSPGLVKRICQDIPGDYVVIKPLSAIRGRGVIIIEKKQLDQFLQTILTKAATVKDHPNPSYSHWYKDRLDSFVVEEFIASDPLITPRLDNKPFDVTLRAVCALVFDLGEITVHIFGMHWKTPKISLADEGSFDDLHQSFGRAHHLANAPVEEEMQQVIRAELGRCLTLLYKEMLGDTK